MFPVNLPRLRLLLAPVVSVALVAPLVGSAEPAFSPISEVTRAPVAFTANDLPTPQTNGIAWSVAQSAGTVYVGGSFSSIRPSRAAAGTSETPRGRFAAFDGGSGDLTSCAPSFDLPSSPASATIRSLDVSPNGKVLYVGGKFSHVNGVARSNLAALSLPSCELVPDFNPAPNGIIRAIEATDSVVYFGGVFSKAAGGARLRAAAVSAVGTTTPGVLMPWDPSPDHTVTALALKPGGGAIVIGGYFNLVGGAESHALAVLSDTTGAVIKAYRPGFIEAKSAVKDIAVDATGFYTANEGSGPGVFDGRIAFDWSDYNQRWRDNCLGATQAVLVHKDVLYSANHAHDCSFNGGFPEGRRYHFLAQRTTDPTLLPWFPNTNEGLGEGIGPRDVVVTSSTSGDIIWSVGEFTKVNGQLQQGLTRFGNTAISAKPTGPQITVSSPTPGTTRIAWRTSLDNDDAQLRYRLYRTGVATPLVDVEQTSWFWNRPQMSHVVTGLSPGSTASFYVSVTDGATTANSPTRTVTVAATSSEYADRVLADGAASLWRYDDPAGTFWSDSTDANRNVTLANGGSALTAGALVSDTSKALTFPGGKATAYSEVRLPAPKTYTVETWFKTTTATGGKLVGFGNNQTHPSSRYDRHVYMTDTGQVIFGVYSGGFRTVKSPEAYNDGAWHHLAATQDETGMKLYVDGAVVASSGFAAAESNKGYWRLGGDNLAGWPFRPTTDHWAGTLDETAIYEQALAATTIANHRIIGLQQGEEVQSAKPSAPETTVSSPEAGSARIAWRQSLDPDNSTLRYRVYRTGSATPLFEVESASSAGARRQTSHTVGDLVPGTEVSFYVTVSDGTNTVTGDTRTVTVADAAPPYAARVLADGPSFLLRYDDPSGAFLSDSSANNINATVGAGVVASSGAIAGDPSQALDFPGGTTSAYSEIRGPGPSVYTIESWFKTTTQRGGKLIGFGNNQIMNSNRYDRHVYMTNSGQLTFGVWVGSAKTVTSPAAYNDGAWHHLVATQDDTGMKLYVDGVLVGSSTVATAESFTGYWRIGGDNLAGWPSRPASDYWVGSLDETAVYPTALSPETVTAHHNLGVGQAANARP